MYDQIDDNVSNPSFWEQKYQTGDTHWDLGGPTPAIIDWINRFKTSQKICVLGAGNGHDAIEISKLGHQVTAVDFSKTAISILSIMAEIHKITVDAVESDLFHLPAIYTNYFDIVIEYTCFCAIHPSRRAEYRDVVEKILTAKGILMALFFPITKLISKGGPPFGIDINETIPLFEECFLLKSKSSPALSIHPRLGEELLVEFQKI